MSPEEIRAYVDSELARQMVQHTSRLYMTVWIVPLATMLLSWVGAYLIERFKNAGTKRDIGRITSEQEAVKIFYAKELERLRNEFARDLGSAKEVHDEKMELLKSQLGERTHFGKTRYEREMKVYEDIWPRLEGFRGAVKALRPVLDAYTASEAERDAILRSRIDTFLGCQRSFLEAFLHARPFFPQSVFNTMLELRGMCWTEAVEYSSTLPRDFDWAAIMETSEAIDQKIDEIAEVIRTRLAMFDHAVV